MFFYYSWDIFFIICTLTRPSRYFTNIDLQISPFTISPFHIQTSKRKKKKFDDDGTKSRIDHARFVLLAPSLIHSSLSIQRIKCRVSDIVEKKNLALHPRFTHLLRFLYPYEPYIETQQRWRGHNFVCIRAREINKSCYSIIGRRKKTPTAFKHTKKERKRKIEKPLTLADGDFATIRSRTATLCRSFPLSYLHQQASQPTS